MTPTQKRELIAELADRFWPAKVVAPLSPGLDDSGFLYLEFFDFDSVEEDASLNEVVREVQKLVPEDHKIHVLELDYSYVVGKLQLYSEVEVVGVLRTEVEERAEDLILESISESLIRERFDEFDLKFFESMQSTPADWRME